MFRLFSILMTYLLSVYFVFGSDDSLKNGDDDDDDSSSSSDGRPSRKSRNEKRLKITSDEGGFRSQ